MLIIITPHSKHKVDKQTLPNVNITYRAYRALYKCKRVSDIIIMRPIIAMLSIYGVEFDQYVWNTSRVICKLF